MPQVPWVQNSFNGGELSHRLRGRRDQSIYTIGVSQMIGFAPLVEGGAEAMPGTVWVAQAKGPCRLFRFEYNVTQGHVIEASTNAFRIYTNDARMKVGGAPVEVATPWDWNALQSLRIHQSYDVMYCFHGSYQTRQFIRDAATSFHMETLNFENGPFDDRNTDEGLTVTSSATSGDVTLEASAALFVASDVGSLFQLEAEDFGDTPQWEPGKTVSVGDLRVSNSRVYGAVTSGTTGSVQPTHTTGIEWDGSTGAAIGSSTSTGVQWKYIHDLYGILKITGFTDSTHVSATVLRTLPFSAATSYSSGSGYYNPETGEWIGASDGVDYVYGTWRWRFGAFSDTRGWPEGGCVWKERLCLFKKNRIYLSVAADLTNFATWNENGDISADMAFQRQVDDPNAVRAMVAGDNLVVYNARGVYMLVPESAASALGPENAKLRRVNSGTCGLAQPVLFDNRTMHIDRSQRRVYEVDLDNQRAPATPVDLTRYARHIGAGDAKLLDLALQQEPSNHLWAVRANGTLAVAAYLDEEQVLGWAQRPLAPGVAARSICSITDPNGEFDQIWIAAEFGGAWHVIRMGQWREDGESGDDRVMVDLAAIYDDGPTQTLTAPHLANQTVDVIGDTLNFWRLTADSAGVVTLPQAVSTAIWGLAYEGSIESLDLNVSTQAGPSQGKMAQVGRAWLFLEKGRGLAFGDPTGAYDLEQLTDGDPLNQGWAAEDGFRLLESVGDNTRSPRLRLERRAPFCASILSWGCMMDVAEK